MIALLLSLLSGTILFQDRFDRLASDTVRLADIQASWPRVTWANGLADGRVTRLPADSCVSGTCVRVSYPAGSWGPSTGGAQWRTSWSGGHDTVWSRYRVRFGEGFDFVKGGKLPGLCGSNCNTGGEKPTGDDGWSARLMWRDSGKAVLYLYWADQPGTYAVDFPLRRPDGSTVRFRPGTWHTVQTRVFLNTPAPADSPSVPGRKDGRVQVWFDGTLALDSSGFRLRNRDTMHVDQFYFSTFHGGSTSDWAPSTTVHADFDDFAVGTDDSPVGVVPRRPTPPPEPPPGTPRDLLGRARSGGPMPLLEEGRLDTRLR